MPCNTLVLNKILKLYKILLNIYTFRLIVSLSHRWSHSEIFCLSSSPLFAYQYISISVSQPFHALRDLATFSWLFVTSKLCKILLDISVCLLFSLSYRQSKATKDSLLSACPPHRCFTIYFAFTGRTWLDFHCCLATSG